MLIFPVNTNAQSGILSRSDDNSPYHIGEKYKYKTYTRVNKTLYWLHRRVNFPTFQEFPIIPCYLCILRRRYMYFAVYSIVHCWRWLFVFKARILPCCMPELSRLGSVKSYPLQCQSDGAHCNCDKSNRKEIMKRLDMKKLLLSTSHQLQPTLCM